MIFVFLWELTGCGQSQEPRRSVSGGAMVLLGECSPRFPAK
mgnify:CR=1 FL=1